MSCCCSLPPECCERCPNRYVDSTVQGHHIPAYYHQEEIIYKDILLRLKEIEKILKPEVLVCSQT